MKGVVVTTKGDLSIRDFQAPLYRSVGEAVGGYIETVHPRGLSDPYVMIVNEEGLLEGLKPNVVGSYLYGTHLHGQPIVGDIVFMKVGYVGIERDILGLEDAEIEEIKKLVEPMISKIKDPAWITGQIEKMEGGEPNDVLFHLWML